MPTTPSSKTIEEVERYIKQNRDLYQEYLRELGAELERLKNSPD
jgi:hypothetical protein